MQGIPTVSVDQVPTPLPEGITVLDVREPVEWQHGHVDGSVHVPMMEIPDRVGELPTDSQVLVVCKVGGRSARVVQYLVAQGVDAVNLDGGLLEWEAAGRPLVSDAGDPMVV
ncbi:MAG: rhodanese-like domain-containing protein [Propionibacteriales bacterium]|nr:rhodanese-like domain-containing protein [Propionibacteriales bacterium]